MVTVIPKKLSSKFLVAAFSVATVLAFHSAQAMEDSRPPRPNRRSVHLLPKATQIKNVQLSGKLATGTEIFVLLSLGKLDVFSALHLLPSELVQFIKEIVIELSKRLTKTDMFKMAKTELKESLGRSWDQRFSSPRAIATSIQKLHNQCGIDLACVCLKESLAHERLALSSIGLGWEQSTLYYACENGDLEGVKIMLLAERDNGARKILVLRIDGTEGSALHMAASKGFLEIVKELIHVGGCDLICLKDLKGRTALHLAAEVGYDGIAQELLTGAGDQVIPLMDITDREKKTAYKIAKEHNHKNVMAVLKEMRKDALSEEKSKTRKRKVSFSITKK